MGSGASKTGKGEKQTVVSGGFKDPNAEYGEKIRYKSGDSTKLANSSFTKGIPISITKTFSTSKGDFVEYSWKTSSGQTKKSTLPRKTFFNRLWAD